MAEDLSARLSWALSDAVKALSSDVSQPKSGTATFVRRDSDGTCWVRLPGADSDTPVNGGMLAEAQPGQAVSYRIESGRLSVIGNASAPSVGAVHVQQAVQPAYEQADRAYGAAIRAHAAADAAEIDAARAHDAADDAQASADDAATAASNAQSSADAAASAASVADGKAEQAATAASNAQASATQANNYALGALAGLSTLESVIDTVSWFADHRKASTDTTVDPSKTYYEYDAQTGTMSAVTPEGTENPSQEGWYELDETIQNYVASHVATTDDGLYVASLSNGWRVLVSSGGGDYTAGVFIVDPQGVIQQATTANGITFDDSKPFTIGDEDAYIVFDGNGHITIGGDGTSFLGSVTIGGSNKTLSDLLTELGSAITAVEYGVGTSSSSHSDITSWSTSTPTWEAGKYVWMRTTTNGLTYTYTCIQGADGPQGAAGASVTVSSNVTNYASSTSGTSAPSSGWQTSIPSVAQGSYLWTRVVTTFSDGSTATSYTASRQGSDGTNGTNGTSYYTHIMYATDSSGTGMTATPSSSTTYIGIYTGTSSTAPTSASAYTWSKYVGNDGDAGPEAVVTITPTAIDWGAGTATLSATLRVNGTITTPTSYKWTKGTSTTSLGTQSTLSLDGSTNKLDATYNCTVTW